MHECACEFCGKLFAQTVVVVIYAGLNEGTRMLKIALKAICKFAVLARKAGID